MAKINSNRSMITLNINYINISIKRQRLAEKMKKSPTTSCLQKTPIMMFSRLKVKG